MNVGGDLPEERFWLSFGDVMGLSGDYFSPAAAEGGRDVTHVDDGDLGSGTLFDLGAALLEGRASGRVLG